MTPECCPHGVELGPGDAYFAEAGKGIFSTYCAECHREQMGEYPHEDEWELYKWPDGRPQEDSE